MSLHGTYITREETVLPTNEELYWDALHTLNDLIADGDETKDSLLDRLEHDLGFEPVEGDS